MRDGYDIVIVGGGSSGAVLAARLSEDPSRSILLLEAGAAPRDPGGFPPALLDAGTLIGAMPDGEHNWAFGGRFPDGRDHVTVRGRILGGSSTINGGYFIRPRLADFDRWSSAAAPAWGYEQVLPLLTGLERDLDYGAAPGHGAHGPIPVRRIVSSDPATEAIRAAAATLGLPEEPDKNDQGPPGIGPVPTNVLDGIRWNTALGYLLPVMTRRNLTVLGGAVATRVRFSGGRAVGIDYLHDGCLAHVAADEVVLAAGALKSPQLLMLSGIGPEAELSRLSIPILLDAPRIGADFGDHPQWVLDWLPRHPVAPPAHTWLSLALHAEQTEVLTALRPMAALLGTPAPADARLPVLVTSMRPRRSGGLRLTSADPLAQPVLDFDYLADADARGEARAAVRLAAELLTTRPCRAESAGATELPRDDAELDAWLLANLGTAMHTCGTAPFGDEDAPVDPLGSVKGVEGLRVADLSILPTAPTRGPAVAAVLVGEIVARAMSSRS